MPSLRSAASISAGAIADDVKLGGLDSERKQRARKVGAVEVVAVATDELRAGDDERGREPGQSSLPPRVAVTVRAFGA